MRWGGDGKRTSGGKEELREIREVIQYLAKAFGYTTYTAYVTFRHVSRLARRPLVICVFRGIKSPMRPSAR